MRRPSVIALLVGLALASVVRADPAPPDDAAEAEARRLYDEGTTAYRGLDYAEAIKDYRAAYLLVPKPFFIYNIAQAYRLSGDPRNAAIFYENFLGAMPDAPNRGEVEKLIGLMHEAAARQPAGADHVKIPSPVHTAETTPPPPALPAQRDQPRPIYKKWWFWAGIGAVAVGATVTVLALSGGKGVALPMSDLGNRPVFP